jgi:hypothetical protein
VDLLTLLGAAGEAVGIDMHFKSNIVKRRVHSRFRQGCMYYDFLSSIRQEWVEPLSVEFERLLNQHSLFCEVFGVMY